MKKLTALFCLAAMVLLLFSGCATSASGTESVLDAIDAFYDAVSSGNWTSLNRLFLYDHFSAQNNSLLADGPLYVVNHAADLRFFPFYGERNSVCVDTKEIGLYRNDAEMRALAQTIYEECGLDLSLQEQIFIQSSFVTGTDSYNAYVQAVQFGTEQDRNQFSDPYELTFDIVCIDDRYYIRNVSFWLDETIWLNGQNDDGSSKATTAKNAQVSSTVQGYTLDEVKANYNGTAMGNGFYIKKGDLFYPCAVGTFLTGNYPIFSTLATMDGIPRLDLEAGEQLVCFSPYTITSVPVCASEYHGKTAPVAIQWRIWYESDSIDMTLLPVLYDSQLIDRYIQTCDDPDAARAFFNDLEIENCVIGKYSNDDFWGDVVWDMVEGSIDEEVGTVEIGGTDFYEDYYTDDTELSAIFACLDDAELTLEYYVGSQWKQVTLPATLDFWCMYVQSGEAYNVPLSTTKDGYYIIDTEYMERGTYAIYNAASTDWSSYPYYDKDEHAILYEDWVYESNLYYDNATIFSVQ